MKNDTGCNSIPKSRKAELILEGAAYRSGIIQAKTQLKHDFSAGNMMHVAAGSVAGLAGAGLRSALSADSVRVLSFLPSIPTVGSYISRKKLLKPAIGIGVAALLAIFLIKLHSRQSGSKSG